jgi:threonine aldolase
MGAEAVILLNPDRAEHFKFFRKQSMQLSSKMRFIAAQFDAYLTGDLWKKNATHSNSMAQILGNKLKGISPLVQVTQKVQANGVFVKMPNKILPELLKKTFFYVWRPLDGDFSEVRLMCSFDTIQEDIQSLVGAIENLVGQN